jgi:hypothetical protein
LDAVGQACAYAHGRVIVAKAEAAGGALTEAKAHLDSAIERLSAALGNAKAAA